MDRDPLKEKLFPRPLGRVVGEYHERMQWHYEPTPLDLPPPPDPDSAERLRREYEEKRGREFHARLPRPPSMWGAYVVVILIPLAIIFLLGPTRELLNLLGALVGLFR